MLRALVIVMASLVSAGILGGCDEAETPTVDSFPSRTPVATGFSRTLSPVTETPGATALDSTNPDAAPAVMHAESLEALVSWYPHIVVGKIDALVEVLVSESVVDGQTFESSPISVYSVSVQQVIASGGKEIPANVLFRQAGGLGRDGSRWEIDKLPTVGQTYLMFLQDISYLRGEHNYTGASFARFIVSEDSKVAPNGWESAPGVEAVSNVSPAEVGGSGHGEVDESTLRALARRPLGDAASAIRDVAIRTSPVHLPIPPGYTPAPMPSPTLGTTEPANPSSTTPVSE